jgi:hypothetical protein
MLRLLIDQNFDQDILRGLAHRIPNLDAVTAYDMGLSTATDPELLEWAADSCDRPAAVADRSSN